MFQNDYFILENFVVILHLVLKCFKIECLILELNSAREHCS